jgi:hypothetical protein
MQTGTEMKRSNAVRKTEQHESADPFCAVHPDLSEHKPKGLLTNGDSVFVRVSEPPTPRAHVSGDRVMVARKKK